MSVVYHTSSPMVPLSLNRQGLPLKWLFVER